MTKEEKIKSLDTAMTVSKRTDNQEPYNHFTDSEPKELIDIFLKNYEVRDIDYETFNKAIGVVSESYADNLAMDENTRTEDIYERSNGSASVYTSDQLEYINIWNQSEITDHVRDMSFDIGTAAAYWYENQVQQAAILIRDWIEA